MLCQPIGCGCSIRSGSITITGSGGLGDPYQLTALGVHVCTSTTRPTPVLGLEIYETDTLHVRIYDGVNWVIIGGAWPGVSLYDNAAQSVTDNANPTAVFANEVYDPLAFHAGTTGVITIPTGYGGDYDVDLGVGWAFNATGNRIITLTIASNATVTNEAASVSAVQITHPVNTVHQGISDMLRLEAGATLTCNINQTSGGALNATNRRFRVVMRRHIPTLT